MYLDKSEKIFLPVKICKYKVPYTFYIGKKGCVSHYYETLTKDVLSYICTVLFKEGLRGELEQSAGTTYRVVKCKL